MNNKPPDASEEPFPTLFAYPDLGKGDFTALWTRLGIWSEQSHSYWLTRFVILRLLGLVYFVAFLSLANQVLPLIGKDGLLPIGLYLRQAEKYLGSRSNAIFEFPSLFWINSADPFLVMMAWLGVILSLLVLLGFANAILMAAL